VSRADRYPAYRTASEITNAERRLAAAGQEVPQKKPSFWERVLWVIDRPRAMGAGAVSGWWSRPSTGLGIKAAAKGAWEGLTGKRVLWGMDLWRQAAEMEPRNWTEAGAKALGRWLTAPGDKPLMSTDEAMKAFGQWGEAPPTVRYQEPPGRREVLGELLAGFAVDPMTYVGVGGATKVLPRYGQKALARRIGREVTKATGKTLTRASTARLAANALRGDIPVGGFGAAVRKAMGETMEAVEREVPLGRLARAETKTTVLPSLREQLKTARKTARAAETEVKYAGKPIRTATMRGLHAAGKGIELGHEGVRDVAGRAFGVGSLKELTESQGRALMGSLTKPGRAGALARRAKKAAEGFDVTAATTRAAEAATQAARLGERVKDLGAAVKRAPARATEYVSTGMKAQSILRVGAIPIANVTPIKTALGATIQRVPGMTKLTDTLGRAFIFNYTPLSIRGAAREAITGAKKTVTAAAAKGPAVARRALRETLGEWHGVSREAAERAAGVIEETVRTADPAVLGAAARAKALFARDVALFQKKGIPLGALDNYVMHLYKDPPARVKEILSKWRGRKIHVKSAKPGFTYARTIPTIEQAKALGLHPVEDVRVLTSVHRAMAEQAAVFQDMGRALLGMGKEVVVEKAIEGYIQLGDEIPALAGKYVHPEVANTLRAFYPVLTNTDEAVNAFTRNWDNITNTWKAVVLATPTFSMRNLAGGIFLNAADGVINPGRYAQATALMIEAGAGFGKGVLREIELAGRRVPAKVVWEWFEDAGLPGQGMYRSMIREMSLTQEAQRTISALEHGGLGKVAYIARHPFQSLREFGEAGDTWNRLTNFLHHLDQGLGPAEAARLTRLAQFDYGQLTPFERQIKRWGIPFYPWRRFVLPRLVERLLGAPGVFTGAAHFRDALVRGNDVDETHLPDWLRDNQALPLFVDAEGNVHYLTLNLPYTELSAIHDPWEVQEWGRELLANMHPLVKAIPEAAFNQVLYTGHKINRTAPGPGWDDVADYAKYVLQSFGGLPGRELASAMIGREQAVRETLDRARGREQEVPSFRKALAGMPLTIQHPARWAREALYERRDTLREAIGAAERRGVVVPTTEELQRPSFLSAVTRPKQYVMLGGGGSFARAVRGQGQEKVQVGQAPSAVREAVWIAGVPRDWEPWLIRVMDQASGGNPVAYDAGSKRTGLFGLTPAEFRRFAGEGMADIWNPLHNTVAAIRRIRAMWGHPSRMPGVG